MSEAPDDDARESARLEAFSDGVFAIAITLLVLELKVPPFDAALGPALLERWPSYVAFVLSFAMIGIMWLNHHRLFAYIRRVDHMLVVINGMLLLGVTFLPFPTAVVAEHFGHAGERGATLFYAATLVFIALGFNALLLYPMGGGRAKTLLEVPPDHPAWRAIARQYRPGVPLYLALFLLALVWPRVSQIGLILFALFFALPPRKASVMR